ncbi:MAG: S9 family peptidase [Vicinamibacterales bacterium]|nr:S9 family peptidase [Vicinamibacterales bacterium]
MRTHITTFLRAAIIVGLGLAAPAGATAQTLPRAVVLDDFSRVHDVGAPQVSPDGEWVLYTVSSADLVADRRDTDLWMVKWDGSERVRLTHSPESESAPRWSPDGRYISFLSSRPGPAKGSQVWVLSRAGGEARPLTALPGRISSYEWSPDATRLVLVYRDEPPAENRNAAPIVVNRYQFKRDGVKYLTGDVRTRLYLYDIASARLEALTADGDYEESDPQWAPDGTRIAFVSNHEDDWDRVRNNDVFVVDARAGARSRRLTTWEGMDGGTLAWSPDSTLIAYQRGSARKFDFHNLLRLGVVPAAGGETRVLTEALDRGVSSPAFTADGRAIVVTVADDRTVYLARVPVAGGEVERVLDGPRVVSQPSLVARRLAALITSDTQPGEIYAIEPSGPRRLTMHNDALVAELVLQPAEAIDFPSADGTRVGALLTRPAGHRAGTRVPLLVRIHGGPTAQDTHGFNFERQLFAAHGYAVVNINYRGSSGRGAAFSEAIFADWGRLEVADVLAGVDYLVAQGVADPDRLGLGGWSYGGLMTNFIIASDTRFKAGISGAGSANRTALYGHEQYTFLYDNEFGPPWENTALWITSSYAFFNANRITTPTLYMGGEDDWNVPILGSEQMYQALKTLKVPTELVVYPGQNHGLTKLSFQRDRLERYLAWYGRYLRAGAATSPPVRHGG